MLIGLDPGSVSGSYGVLDDNGAFVCCGNLPTSPLGGAGKDQVNPALLANLLREIHPDLAVIERVGAMPGNGSVAMFRFGTAFGIILGVVAALKIPFLLVSPAAWKKGMGLIGQNKDAARTLALQKWPDAAQYLKLKKDHGRADSLLMAEWKRTHHITKP